jgi:hypothetical protein
VNYNNSKIVKSESLPNDNNDKPLLNPLDNLLELLIPIYKIWISVVSRIPNLEEVYLLPCGLIRMKKSEFSFSYCSLI